MRKSTMVELVQELEKLIAAAPRGPQRDGLKFMLKEAINGEYHDYKNKKYACGKFESYNRLIKLGFPELANRIKNGEFDEVADEEDKALMRKDLPKNMWKVFGLEP